LDFARRQLAISENCLIMSKRRRIARLALLGILLISFALALSRWLDEEPADNSADLVQPMGTNALPLLLKKLQDQDSIIKEKIIELLGKQWLIHVRFRQAYENHHAAIAGFATLGPAAKPAVPMLIQMLTNQEAFVRVNAAGALGAMRSAAREAVPALVNSLNDTNHDMQASALYALGQIGEPHDLIAAVLLGNLQDPNQHIRFVTISALSSLTNQAKIIVPELFKIFDSDSRMRYVVIESLKRLDPKALEDLLFQRLTESDPGVRLAAMRYLHRIGVDGSKFLPPLLDCLANPDHRVRLSAIYSLERFGDKARPVVPAMLKSLQDENSRVRQAATNALVAIDPAAAARVGIRQ